MSSTTLLPIGTMVYYKGCEENPTPDFGIITSVEDETRGTWCTVRDCSVNEQHYVVEWWDGNIYRSTHTELEAPEFIILEDTCN